MNFSFIKFNHIQKFFIFVLIGLSYYSCGYVKLFNNIPCIGLKHPSNNILSKSQIELGHVVINGHKYQDELVYVFHIYKLPLIKFIDDLSLVSEDDSSSYKFNEWIRKEGLQRFVKKITSKMMYDTTLRITNFIFTKKASINVIDQHKNEERYIPYASPLID
jgi:hypothetical protein